MQLWSVRAILSWWANGGPLVTTPQALLKEFVLTDLKKRLSWLKFIFLSELLSESCCFELYLKKNCKICHWWSISGPLSA